MSALGGHAGAVTSAAALVGRGLVAASFESGDIHDQACENSTTKVRLKQKVVVFFFEICPRSFVQIVNFNRTERNDQNMTR